MSCSLEERICFDETQKYYIPTNIRLNNCFLYLINRSYYWRLPYLLLSMDGECEDLEDDFSDLVDELAEGC